MKFELYIKNQTDSHKNSYSLYNLFLHQRGKIWGRSRGLDTHSNLNKLISAANYTITNGALLLALIPILNFHSKHAAFTLTGINLISSIFQLLDVSYMRYYQRKPLYFLIFPLSKLIFWASRGMVLAMKHNYTSSNPSLLKGMFWTGLISSAPNLFLIYKYCHFLMSSWSNSEWMFQNSAYFSNPFECLIESMTFFAFDEMAGINQFLVPLFITDFFVTWFLFLTSGISAFAVFFVIQRNRGISLGVMSKVLIFSVISVACAYLGIEGSILENLYSVDEERIMAKSAKIMWTIFATGVSSITFWYALEEIIVARQRIKRENNEI